MTKTRLHAVLDAHEPEIQNRARSLGADPCMDESEGAETFVSRVSSLVAGSRSADTVLIIDDEPAARYILRHRLTALPCSALEAENGAAGLNIARSDHPRVIFLDLMMTGMSGFETLEQLKSDPLTRDIPVIITTAKVLDVRERRILTTHAEAILPRETIATEAAMTNIRRILFNAGLETESHESR